MNFWGHQLTRYRSWITFPLAFLLLPSCLEEFNELKDTDAFKYNPEIAIPLLSSQLTIQDLINNADVSTVVEVDDDGLVNLVYRQELGSIAAPSLTLPDQHFEQSTSLPGSAFSPTPITETISHNQVFNQEIQLNNDDMLDSVHIKSGHLEITMQSDFWGDRQTRVTINSLEKDGVPLEFNLESKSGEFSPTPAMSVDLSGYSIDLTEQGSSSNTFSVEVEIMISFNHVPVNLSQSVVTRIDLLDLELSGLFGQLDERKLSGQIDTLEVDIFDFSDHASLEFNDPQLSFTFKNSFGIPIGVEYRTLVTKNVNGEIIEGSGSAIDREFLIDAPSLDQMGSTVESTANFNQSNSNIIQLLSRAPNIMVMDYDLTLNPESESGRFLVDDNRLEASLELRIPLAGIFADFSLQNTFGFSGTDLNDVDSYLMRFTTTNAFPFSIDLQVFWLDNTGVVLDSALSNTELVASGAFTTSGDLLEPTISSTEFSKSREEIELLRQATQMLVRARLSAESHGEIHSNHFVGIKLGAQAVLDL